ncbi:regulatory protein, tetR family [Nonomuraea solani]|uniref:Regulatory protein, tetR family n=1 Tax=Nonomuraea solani TaxID=1144553 RepID=A0A1H6F2X2_9ACTN|nr:TetR/AcrR family transcriptional regulator [Nonomuraea solani]SEH03569.1 regulatory protein, tetR family [Nonomuraea solani]
MPRAVSTPKELGALRQDLLDAALRILRDQGALYLTLRRVADAAGTSTMGIYTCFGGRTALLEAIYEHGFRLLRQAMTTPLNEEATPLPTADNEAASPLGADNEATPLPGADSPLRVNEAPTSLPRAAEEPVPLKEGAPPAQSDEATFSAQVSPDVALLTQVGTEAAPLPQVGNEVAFPPQVSAEVAPPAQVGDEAAPPTPASNEVALRTSTSDEAATPVARILEIAFGYRQFALTDPALYALMFERPLPDFDPSPQQRDDALRLCFDLLAEATTAATQAGLINATTPERAAYLVWTTIHGLVSIELTCSLRTPLPGWFLNSREEGERVLQEGVQALISGLGTAPESPKGS